MIKVKKVVKKKGSEGGTETTTTSEEVTTVTETTNTKSQNGYENGKRSVSLQICLGEEMFLFRSKRLHEQNLKKNHRAVKIFHKKIWTSEY